MSLLVVFLLWVLEMTLQGHFVLVHILYDYRSVFSVAFDLFRVIEFDSRC